MKKLINSIIDENRDKIISIGRTILDNPEMGYKEYKTSKLVKDVFEELNIEYVSGLGITGVKATVGKNPGPNICIIGEMDAIKSFDHPKADKTTGAAHACGHNAQIAAMLGAAIGIAKSGIMDRLNGKITFFAVPAEEYTELEFRNQLRKDGKITYFGGKQELIHIGAFDDVDIAMMIHMAAGIESADFFLGGSSLGFNAKIINFYGKTTHGSTPYRGINALNAAMLSLMAINANRDTFRDEDHVRIHPIITNGGDSVNVIPAKATIETYVRAANINALNNACEKVDDCLKAGALAMGAEVEIEDFRGYLPQNQNSLLDSFMEENAADLLGNGHIIHGIDMTGSTDMGDLENILPAIQPRIGGVRGSGHGSDYEIINEETAYIISAKLLAMTAYDLLENDAKKAKMVIDSFKNNMKV